MQHISPYPPCPCPFLPSPSPLPLPTLQHYSLPSPPPPAAPSLSCRPLSRGCVWVRESVCEGKRGKPLVEWICALSLPPFLLLLLLLLYLICPPSPSSASIAPWAPSVPALGEKETRPVDRQQKTELQCQQEIRRMVVTNQEVIGHSHTQHTYTNIVCPLTILLYGQHPLLLLSLLTARDATKVCMAVCCFTMREMNELFTIHPLGVKFLTDVLVEGLPLVFDYILNICQSVSSTLIIMRVPP